MRILKQAVGIDVAQKELVVSIGRMQEDLSLEVYASKVLPNTPKGFVTLVSWVGKLTDPTLAVRYVMEATGVYHESLAYYLAGQGQAVSIVLPNKISNYMRTLEVKTITDKTAAEAIVRFGLERKLDNWQPPKDVFKKLRQLTREREQIIEERTMAKNQLHAEKTEAEPNKRSLKRMEERIQLLSKQEKEIKKEIAALISSDKQTAALVVIICSLPGVGLLTAAIVLSETNGFELIRNKRQLTSYAGLDVTEKQSGTSVKGKPKISKKGNKYLRKAMHLPALAAIRHDERFKAIFSRLAAKHGIKMKATVAVQRKLLEMIFTLATKKVSYDKTYLTKQKTETNANVVDKQAA